MTQAQTDDKPNDRPSRRDFVRLTSIGAVVLGNGLLTACGGGGDLDELAEKAKKTKMDTPTIACDGATQVSLFIKVTAGASGTPAGFSLQWMTADALAALNGVWPSSDSLTLCKASFSGNANLSRYNLGAFQTVTVNIGEFLFDNGASTNCASALLCGTAYVFRAFAHASSSLQRSDSTANLTCSTLACGSGETCTYTQGYWKTHGPVPEGNNSNEWPVAALVLGTVSYTDLQLLSILQAPAKGNGLIALAHQLIAAKLNLAKGADGTAVATAVPAADTMIGALVVPPIGTGYLAPDLTSALVTVLEVYNEGGTGPGHCA
jgi:hypothetical protein